VLITHAHSDHTGFAERARTTAEVPVWIHQVDAAVARGAKPTNLARTRARACWERAQP
jgi:glyoxylase-like metal-dependent hydrolase (beta-lactamase superfamily II)